MTKKEMPKKVIYEEELDCECGGLMKPRVFNVEGMNVRGWKCTKCSRIDYSDDIDRVLQFRKLSYPPPKGEGLPFPSL